MRKRGRFYSAAAGAALLMTAFAPALRPDPAGVEDAAARIDRLLVEAYAPNVPGAAVLVSKKGALILRKGYGMANLEQAVPVSPGTIFRIASLTKAFTAAAVFALAEKGRLGLDDPASKHLPDYPWKKGIPALKNLLGHTSGIPDFLDRPDSMRWARGEYTVAELIDTFKDRNPNFAPGERLAYSNSNYVLLGAVLEAVTGRPFASALQELVLRPLELRQTYYDEELTVLPGRAAGYEPLRKADDSLDWTTFRNVRYYSMSSVYAAGGCLSTVDDLHAFYRGLRGGKLFGEGLRARFLEPVRLTGGTAAGGTIGGWQIDRLEGKTVFMKGGSLPGVCAWFLFQPDEDVCVILLSNRSAGEPRCGPLALEIAKLALAAK